MCVTVFIIIIIIIFTGYEVVCVCVSFLLQGRYFQLEIR